MEKVLYINQYILLFQMSICIVNSINLKCFRINAMGKGTQVLQIHHKGQYLFSLVMLAIF